jgi:hypothetical protein
MHREFGHLPFVVNIPRTCMFVYDYDSDEDEWCYEHVKGEWDVSGDTITDGGSLFEWNSSYHFSLEEDAILFKLTWT